NFTGFTVKTGANYNISSVFNVYANAGYLSKAPLFQPVFNNINKATKDIKNETIQAFELGTGYNTRLISVNANVYYTEWKDKTYRRNYTLKDETGQSIVYNYLLKGIDARHMGFELEATSRPTRYLKFDAMLSLGDWEWQNNVFTRVYDDETSKQVDSAFIYIKGLKVGDAAQTTAAFTATAYPYKGLYISGVYKYFAKNYAYFSPENRTKATEEGVQPWKLPNYGLMDLHAGYTIPYSISYLAKIQINFHVFNVLDEQYISDADDGNGHDATYATVYFGLPRQFNAGIILSFY
ncbi:MAG: TonB-dependent receptor, partial [Candidatus Delongbacteria bacterium]|nr:TonB-dependent receptor [Candidatus Delongbacteria bacterium]